MAVTLQQVADACGVSRGTVDRALHGKEGVRPEVARRVREAARELGYLPRRAGTAELRRARIGVVLQPVRPPLCSSLQSACGVSRNRPCCRLTCCCV
ncbi:MAG: LacI family DNA-binding transcriptional regulator [Eubacteriales bacterium]|nr:LacI family DNA-binding transcriptional regulator [Eubacteriales bacterium]